MSPEARAGHVTYRLGVLSGDALLTGGHIGMFVPMAGYLAVCPHAA